MKKTRLPLNGTSGLDVPQDPDSGKRAISPKPLRQVFEWLFFDGLVDAILYLGALVWIALSSVNPKLWDLEEERRIDFLTDSSVTFDPIHETEDNIVLEINPCLIDDYPANLTFNE